MDEYCPSCGACVKDWQSEPKNVLEMSEGKQKMDAGERWMLRQPIGITIPLAVALISAIIAVVRSL